MRPCRPAATTMSATGCSTPPILDVPVSAPADDPFPGSTSLSLRSGCRRRTSTPRSSREVKAILAVAGWGPDESGVAVPGTGRADSRGCSSARLRPLAVASMTRRAGRPLAQGRPPTSGRAPRALRWPLLLRLVEQHRAARVAGSRCKPLADRPGDAAVRPARRDDSLSSNALWRASRNRVSTVPCATAPRPGMWGTVPSCPQRRRSSVAMPARALVLVLDGARRANATTRLSPVTRQPATRSTSLGVRSAIASTVAAATFSASSVGG